MLAKSVLLALADLDRQGWKLSVSFPIAAKEANMRREDSRSGRRVTAVSKRANTPGTQYGQCEGINEIAILSRAEWSTWFVIT